jgi:hypothetical protein
VLRTAPILLLGAPLVIACSQSVAVDSPSLSVTGTDADLDPVQGDDDDATPVDNEAPLADAGDDIDALVADEVELDGSGSYDPDGDAIDFDWTLLDKPIGSSASLINDTRANPSFYADREGTYLVRLEVHDGTVAATDDVSVYVTAANEGPVSNAGPDQTVEVNDRVVLNGSSSYDPDGDVLAFSWVLVSTPGGSVASLDAPTTALPQFTADIPGLYVVELVVSDSGESSLPDQVRITAQEAGSGDGGCFSCAAANQELQRRMRAGDLASAGLVGLLPLLTVLWRRRRSR